VTVLTGYIHDSLTDALTAADVLADAIVTQQVISGPDYDPTITNVDYPCFGWVDTFTNLERIDSSVLQSDRKTYLLASSLTALDVTPVPGNTVTIAGATYIIVTVQLDPAGACWVLQCRV
jgi:hypothetical protein